MSQPSELQNQIIQLVKNNPDLSPQDIAENVNCSVSWVRETINEYPRKLIGQNDLSDIDICLSFFSPYDVYASSEFLEKYNLNIDQPAKIELLDDENNDTYTQIVTIKRIDELEYSKEFRSRVYAINSLSDSLPGDYDSFLSRFTRGENKDLEIYSLSDFVEFSRLMQGHTTNLIERSDLIVGAGLLNENNPDADSESLFLPKYATTVDNLRNKLDNGSSKIVDFRMVGEDEIIQPESVYFTHYGNNIEPEIKADILSRNYYDLEHIKIFNPFDPISGPNTVNSSKRILQVNEENLKFTETQIRVGFINDETLDFETLLEITQDLSIETEHNELDITRSIFRNDSLSRIHFYIGSIPVTLRYDNPSTIFTYPKKPSIAGEFVEALSRNISEATRTTVNLSDTDNIGESAHPMLQSNRYVFDTNAIYNNVHENKPASILEIILNNIEMDDSEIIIPWTVLYEINKHKDRGGPGPRVQEQGIENLNLLNELDELSFISLSIEDFPKSIQAQVAEADIADMSILQSCQNEDAVLISGDNRLRDLGDISDIPVVDIQDLIDVSTIPDLSDDIREEILPRIGTELKYRKEIIVSISEAIETQIQQSQKPEFADMDSSPEDYLTEWLNEGEIISVIDEENKNDEDDLEIIYDRGNIVDVVITPTAIGEVADNIIKHDGGKYLSKDILERLSKLPSVSGPGLPMITFHTPISNVIGPQSANIGGLSTTSRQLYKLKDVKNANYNSEELSEVTSRDEYVHDAVLLAREKGYPLLCAEEDDYLRKISGLIGVTVTDCQE